MAMRGPTGKTITRKSFWSSKASSWKSSGKLNSAEYAYVKSVLGF